MAQLPPLRLQDVATELTYTRLTGEVPSLEEALGRLNSEPLPLHFPGGGQDVEDLADALDGAGWFVMVRRRYGAHGQVLFLEVDRFESL